MSEESKRTTIGKAIQDFLSFHEMNKDSADTMKNYRISLRRFAVWLSSVGVIYVDELALSHLRAWVSHLQKEPSRFGGVLSDATVYQYALRIQVFCHLSKFVTIL
jgi:site-specific recombinase XerD